MFQRFHILRFKDGKNLACPAEGLKFQTLEMRKIQEYGRAIAEVVNGARRTAGTAIPTPRKEWPPHFRRLFLCPEADA
ncbi:MAG: hypothetical protein KJN98_00165, partial [Pontiella sp.]|nr:hypothetical protein [Pontiella sp.]